MCLERFYIIMDWSIVNLTDNFTVPNFRGRFHLDKRRVCRKLLTLANRLAWSSILTFYFSRQKKKITSFIGPLCFISSVRVSDQKIPGFVQKTLYYRPRVITWTVQPLPLLKQLKKTFMCFAQTTSCMKRNQTKSGKDIKTKVLTSYMSLYVPSCHQNSN